MCISGMHVVCLCACVSECHVQASMSDEGGKPRI